MKVLGIIPARGGSKGVHKKNSKLLGGKPLIQFTVEVAQQSKKLAKVILSSDDEEIIAIGRKLGIDVPFKRPPSLATDNAPTIEVVKHALEFFEKKNQRFDAICLLQPTCPFKSYQFIDQAIEHFENSNADSLVSVQKVPDKFNPHWVFEPKKNGFLQLATNERQIITRRQDLPDTYHRDGIIYLTKASVIRNHNSLYGDKLSYVVSPSEFNVNIDTSEDWERAEEILQKRNSKH